MDSSHHKWRIKPHNLLTFNFRFDLNNKVIGRIYPDEFLLGLFCFALAEERKRSQGFNTKLEGKVGDSTEAPMVPHALMHKVGPMSEPQSHYLAPSWVALPSSFSWSLAGASPLWGFPWFWGFWSLTELQNWNFRSERLWSFLAAFGNLSPGVIFYSFEFLKNIIPGSL